LVQEVLVAKMVAAHHERPCLEIWPSMAHCLDEADELALIRRQLGVVRRNGVAEECQWA
jgi:hypothetical protein